MRKVIKAVKEEIEFHQKSVVRLREYLQQVQKVCTHQWEDGEHATFELRTTYKICKVCDLII